MLTKYTFMDALEKLGITFPPDSLHYYGELSITAKDAANLMNQAYEEGLNITFSDKILKEIHILEAENEKLKGELAELKWNITNNRSTTI